MRALKAAVIGMGVLIVAGTVVLAIALVGRVQGRTPDLRIVLDEPAGTRIAAISTAGDRLALQLQGGGLDRVALVDLRTGRVAGHVGLAR